ncbi:M14 family metallopeptidase [Blastopirellula marina]|uniref:DUF2817 domain-containing protein n=1 Tax=Blastopirellula marina TaxID=124 RepID=A0A2S8G1A4_9BACT|nr:M14 family metallopeptidase [Blastopirellula marina]PQO38227.1 DUF2817 domain-containing protein [Blastopirellula marina]PTL44883.1 DUF2817 domain-containing protein [Blastopirellula marina]
MNDQDVFSPDYATARTRFCDLASKLGWQVESFPREGTGPQGEPLVTDAACSSEGDPAKVLVVSSAVHGVEGFFGSAVQWALLRRWQKEGPLPIKCLFLHGINPFGFAWRRRFDENNVDLNRNFLLPGETFAGAPETYAKLDEFLNPHRPPSSWEPFMAKAAWLIVRYGMTALRQAIATGQYEFPQGLFFGGSRPSPLQSLLAENVPRWLQGSEDVVHFDLHTGLGPKGTCKLLIDYPLNDRQRTSLAKWFGEETFEESQTSGIAYEARGGLGRWCVAQQWAPNYLYTCAEFGTYGSVTMLKGLRAENQAQHWCPPKDPRAIAAKDQLAELFCPRDSVWRSQVIQRSYELVDQAVAGLLADA